MKSIAAPKSELEPKITESWGKCKQFLGFCTEIPIDNLGNSAKICLYIEDRDRYVCNLYQGFEEPLVEWLSKGIVHRFLYSSVKDVYMAKMFPYVVYTPAYDPRSGGIKVLHRLVHELNERGVPAFCTGPGNPEWNEPPTHGMIEGAIAVYPEIVHGNPFGAKTVARWVLNVPGRLAGPTEYDSSEIVFPYKNCFNQWNYPNDRVLLLPAIDTDIFVDKHQNRDIKAFYVGKGHATPMVPETEGLYEIRKEDTADQHKLADLLNRIEILYIYDNITALWDCARLCGCPVVIIPNGELTEEDLENDELPAAGLALGVENCDRAVFTINSADFREAYLGLFNVFQDRLGTFIDLTQKRAAFHNSIGA